MTKKSFDASEMQLLVETNAAMVGLRPVSQELRELTARHFISSFERLAKAEELPDDEGVKASRMTLALARLQPFTIADMVQVFNSVNVEDPAVMPTDAMYKEVNLIRHHARLTRSFYR
jgi:hypothetical protein